MTNSSNPNWSSTCEDWSRSNHHLDGWHCAAVCDPAAQPAGVPEMFSIGSWNQFPAQLLELVHRRLPQRSRRKARQLQSSATLKSIPYHKRQHPLASPNDSQVPALTNTVPGFPALRQKAALQRLPISFAFLVLIEPLRQSQNCQVVCMHSECPSETPRRRPEQESAIWIVACKCMHDHMTSNFR